MMLAVQLTDNNLTTVFETCDRWDIRYRYGCYGKYEIPNLILEKIENGDVELKIGEWLVNDNRFSILSDEDFRLKYEVPNRWKGSYWLTHHDSVS